MSKLKAIALTGVFLAALTFNHFYVKSHSSSSREDQVMVYANKGTIGFNQGYVMFDYKGKHLFDDGFNGTLDRVIYHDGKGRVEISNSEKLKEYISLYEEARKTATEMR